jgi:hypothetical protein
MKSKLKKLLKLFRSINPKMLLCQSNYEEEKDYWNSMRKAVSFIISISNQKQSLPGKTILQNLQSIIPFIISEIFTHYCFETISSRDTFTCISSSFSSSGGFLTTLLNKVMIYFKDLIKD